MQVAGGLLHTALGERLTMHLRGRIVEQGRHDELLARPVLYRELYTLQFGPVGAGEGARVGRT